MSGLRYSNALQQVRLRVVLGAQVSVSFAGSAEVADQDPHDSTSQLDLAKLEHLSSRTMTCTADVVAAADAFCATQTTAKSLVEVG